MTQVIDPLPRKDSDYIVCCYVNATSKIQVVRITNIPNWYFERVVFPGQRLMFESLPEAQLEIHTGMMASAILSDTIPCYRLRLHQSVSASMHFLGEDEPFTPVSSRKEEPKMFEWVEAAKVS
jgi:hypothetical protein